MSYKVNTLIFFILRWFLKCKVQDCTKCYRRRRAPLKKNVNVKLIDVREINWYTFVLKLIFPFMYFLSGQNTFFDHQREVRTFFSSNNSTPPPLLSGVKSAPMSGILVEYSLNRSILDSVFKLDSVLMCFSRMQFS